MCESKTKKDHVLEMCRRKRLIDVQIAQELMECVEKKRV